MRILTASDIHGDPKISQRLAEKAEKEKADIVVLCGDLTEFDQWEKGMMKPFLDRGQEVLFVVGNHDMTAGEVLSEKYKITNLQYRPVMVGDVGFFGCGTASVGPNRLSEQDIGYYLEKGFRKIRDAKKKVMVTHMRPAGSIIEKMMPRFEDSGSEAIKDAIYKFHPDFNLCGHIHEADDLDEKMDKTSIIGSGPEGRIVEI